MPGIIRRGRKRAALNISEDEEQSDAPSSASSASKRARHARDASATGEHVQDVHQPGSLVRVKVTNFVTYTSAEFILGPSLNMIIGPNGTGKSTLVCAICIGLGWPTKLLGRSKEVGEFVKHGCAESEIEIELAGDRRHKQNPVVRRHIRKEGNKSVFYIDDRHKSQRDVQELAASFSIQIDNLCQFLPQDRVVDFAKMTPIDKLTETQRAIAAPQMLEWHEQLKDLRSQEKTLQASQINEEAHLKSLQAKQNSTAEDVRRWQEREQLAMTARALERCRPLIEMHSLRAQVAANKQEILGAREELKRLSSEMAPVRQAQEDTEAYRDQINQAVQNRKQRLAAGKQSSVKIFGEIEVEREKVATFKAEIDGEGKGRNQRKQDVKRLEASVATLVRNREQEPVPYNRDDFEERKKELRAKVNETERAMLESQDKMRRIRSQVTQHKTNIQKLKNDRLQLDSESGKRANRLKMMSSDTATGWDWIQRNRTSLKLKDEVYGPPLLTCSVKEPGLVKAVESQLRTGDITAITCRNPDDAKIIQDKLFQDLKLHDITIRMCPQSLGFYRPPITQEELKAYGFDSWIVDCIQGPEPVLAMLCDQNRLHRSAYAARPISSEQFEALQGGPIQKWVSGTEVCQINRRKEYGLSSTSVTQLREARFFTDQPVDGEEKRKLDDAIKDIERDLMELKEQHDTARRENLEQKDVQDQAENEKKEVQMEEDSIKKALAEWNALPTKIKEKEEELANAQAAVLQTGARVRAIRAKLSDSTLKIATLTLEYAKSVTQLRVLQESLVEAEIRLVEATSEVEALTAENHHVLEAAERQRTRLEELKVSKKQLTEKYNNLVKKTQHELDRLSPEEKEILHENKDKTVEELDNEIDATNARLELMAEGNPNALKSYQDRQQLIDKAEEKLEQVAANLSTIQEEIVNIRGQWEPQLDELIAMISDKFAYNFALIGCAGSVGLYKDEDFEKWSVQIQVRFRENETLSVLDSQRQSGGERAVSTAFYLMALQDLARSPFRVVDEINQGMDQRNERKVYERIVDIACRERTSQYFLITPKLLPDLKYHPKMKVHCIASGEHMPDRHTKLDFQALAELALRVKGQGRAAA
ncbi:P-loop containing nucleoside triphosphate hydrolase protein [Corynespora cassiicola Philippines]|uniref:Structural maintenance of chromosomes protein 5 n=1 Tax=Corynespora cassiicola Philippines TaxID=1448308 RepID=A0A2T2NVB7_CORCC|nr:P-loop containing nucleoside triphosphate hydrolase protein [Corynespora cassiicola Philippines]